MLLTSLNYLTNYMCGYAGMCETLWGDVRTSRALPMVSRRPRWLAGAWCTWTEHHRGEGKEIAMLLDRGGYGETHLMLQLAGDAARGEEEGGSSNGVGGDRIGEDRPNALIGRGKEEIEGEMVCSDSL